MSSSTGASCRATSSILARWTPLWAGRAQRVTRLPSLSAATSARAAHSTLLRRKSKNACDRIISDVIALHQRYRCLVWFVEAVQFQEFLRTELIRRSAAQGIPVPARAVSPHSDKMLRIESLQPHMANGLIKLHSEQATLISQLRHFPKADHDDGPDALHMLWAGAVASGAGRETQAIDIPEPTL